MTAFWRAWSIWAVSVTAIVTMLTYNAVNPLPAMLAAQQGNELNGAVGIVFIGAFATVGALLAWKRPAGSWAARSPPRSSRSAP
jgi:hypothetical protein